MKALTVKGVISQLQRLLFEGKVSDDDWVMIEGCDCDGFTGAVEVTSEMLPVVSEYDAEGTYVKEHKAPGAVAYLRLMDP